jgi:tetrahydromethanopterin S-methyltransferase subunit F
MFPVRTLALLASTVIALPAIAQTSAAAGNNSKPAQPAAAQPAPIASQPQTKVLIPESDAAAANSPVESNDPLLSVPPMPKGKTTLVGGQVRNIDQIRNHMDVDSFGGGHMRVHFDERSHFFRNGVETTQLAIRKGDRVYVDSMLDNTRVFARNVRINTGVTAANASGQIMGFNPKTGALTLRDQIAARPVTFIVDQSTNLIAEKNSGVSSVTRNDLKPGALIAVKFAPTGNHGIAREISVLAVPGTVFTFVGRVSNLDMRGLVSVDNQSDQKNYDIHFDPVQTRPNRSLVVGSNVIVKATFDGRQYQAESIEVQ